MEHVLRQCLIALRLAERIGLSDEERAVVYYTALLVNVGCHSDAHEQAKWFGDDIALKSGKYDHEFGSLGGTAAALRLLGSGNPPLHRFRVGLEFVLSGRRELDGMIAQHAAMARLLAEQLGLPDAVRAALGGAYEQWDGHGWPGEAEGEAVPVAARLAQLAEFVEVAHRVGGTDAAATLARSRAGTQFDPALAELVCADGEMILAGLESVGTWDAVIDAEPVARHHARGRTARCRPARHRELRRPQVAVHARPCRGRRRSRRRGRRAARHDRGRGAHAASGGSRARPRTAGSLQRDLGQARAARRRRMGTGADASLPDRAHAASIRDAGAARRDRRAAPRASRRLGLSAGPHRGGDLAPGADPGRGRCVPGDARAAPLPAAAPGCRRRRGAASATSGREGSTGTPSRPCSARPDIASPGAPRGRRG